MKRSIWKDILAFALLVLFLLTYTFLVKHKYLEDNIVNIISFSLGCIFIFSFIVRKNLRFKPYFISRFNFLTSKVRYNEEFNLPKELLFDKFIEVIRDSGFKIVHTDKVKGEIFAISSISWLSWGENIYFTLIEKGEDTTVDFCSACFFQITSWGKNERNINKLLEEFENSLTI